MIVPTLYGVFSNEVKKLSCFAIVADIIQEEICYPFQADYFIIFTHCLVPLVLIFLYLKLPMIVKVILLLEIIITKGIYIMKLNDKIAQLRLSKGYSKYYVAKKVDLSRPTISNIENGTFNPRYDTLVKLARLYGLTPDELLKGAM